MLPLLPTVQRDFIAPPVTAIPPALYGMEPIELNGTFEKLRLHSNGSDAADPPQSAPPTNADEANGREPELLKPHDWTWATLTRNTRITAKDWWQDVREIELGLEDSEAGTYLPGSICSLQPRMSAKEVDDFLELNDLTNVADEVFCLRPETPGVLQADTLVALAHIQINLSHLIYRQSIHLPRCDPYSRIISIFEDLQDDHSSSGCDALRPMIERLNALTSSCWTRMRCLITPLDLVGLSSRLLQTFDS